MSLWDIAALGSLLVGLSGMIWWIVHAEARADRDVAGEIRHMHEDARLQRQLVDRLRAAHQADIRRLRAEIADLRRRIDPTPSGECGEPPATGPHTDSPGQISEPESRSPGAREHGDPAAPTAA